MKVVNLSRRPFVNRRPVVRIAIALWILGALLLLANAWLYADYFRDSSKTQAEMAALQRQLNEETDRLDAYSRDVGSLSLDRRNAEARYLNTLIRQRTFPWSALFDDLERILPIDVYLASVQPIRTLASEAETRSSRSRRPRLTPAEARARARAQRAASREGASPEADQPAARTEPEPAEAQDPGDRVTLKITGLARDDESFFDLLDNLYADPSFEDPDLARESIETKQNNAIAFALEVEYLPPLDGRGEQGGAETDSLRMASADQSAQTDEDLAGVGLAEGASAVLPSLRSTTPRSASSSSSTPSVETRAEPTRSARETPTARSATRSPTDPREALRERLRASRGGDDSRSAEDVVRSRSRPPSRVSVRPDGSGSRRGTDAGGRVVTGVVPGRPLATAPPIESSPTARGRAGAELDEPGGRPTTTRRPGARGETDEPEITPPRPTRPSASATPGLRRGSLFDRLLPDFWQDLFAPAPGLGPGFGYDDPSAEVRA